MIGEFVMRVSKIDLRHMAAHAILPRFGANSRLGVAIRDGMAADALGIVERSFSDDILMWLVTGRAADAAVLRICFETLAAR